MPLGGGYPYGAVFFLFHTMSIIKSKQASDYTVIPNKVFKSGLSIEAIGLLSYFLSLPHDWVIYKTKLHTQLNMGREKLDRVFKELQDSGYVLSVKRQQDSGRFKHEHIVYDKPYNGEPQAVKPDTAFPCMADQPLLSKELTKETKQKKKKREKKELSPFIIGKVKPELMPTFLAWLEYKKQSHYTYTDKGCEILIKKINKLTPAQFEYVYELSVMNNWVGLFPEKAKDMPVTKPDNNLPPSQFSHESW